MVQTAQTAVKQLKNELHDHMAINRAIERIRERLNVLLATPPESQEQVQAACVIRQACRLAALAMINRVQDAYTWRYLKCEAMLPSRIDIQIGMLCQAVRIMERTWRGELDLPIVEALTEVIRCNDELLAIFQAKGYDLKVATQKALEVAKEAETHHEQTTSQALPQ